MPKKFNQNLLLRLDKLAANPGIIESIKEMEYDRDNGLRHVDPKKYAHNIRIKRLFDRAKEIAWNQIKSDPRIQQLIEEERKKEPCPYRTSIEIQILWRTITIYFIHVNIQK